MNSSQTGNIEQAKIILNLIGTPFNDSTNSVSSDLNDLYTIAQKNKIGLLFLESLSQKNIINGLQEELTIQRKSYSDQRETTARVSKVLNMIQCKHVIIKSSFPFPAVPNDVDVLILGDDEEFNAAIKHMQNNNYELMQISPLETFMHDGRSGQHVNLMIKEAFDADIYKEVGASHIVYMDKKKLIDHISEETINGAKVTVFKPAVEMALSIFHSIFPERIYTLLLHFYILHTIKQMNSSDIEEFMLTCNDHKISNAVLTALRITEKIQEICFGESPDKVTKLREAFGKKIPIEISRIPHQYPMKLILNSFLSKSGDLAFTCSALRQAISMINPKMVRYIISEYTKRKNRDTY